MARQVITSNDLTRIRTLDQQSDKSSNGTPEAKADRYMDRLLKYIPAEIVAVFILVNGLVEKLDHNAAEYLPILWGVFILFSVLTPLYLLRIQKVKKIVQLLISLVSFLVWVFALGGPFLTLGWYNPIYGEILLPVFTIIIALVVAEK